MDLCKADLIRLSKEDIIHQIEQEQAKFRGYVMNESGKNILDLTREELVNEIIIETKKSNMLNKFVKNLEHDNTSLNKQLSNWGVEVHRLKTEVEMLKQKEIENAQLKEALRDLKRIEVLFQNTSYEEILTVYTKEELVEMIQKERKEFHVAINQIMLQAKSLAAKNVELEVQMKSLNRDHDKLKVELETSNVLKDLFDAELKAHEEQDQIIQKVLLYF